MKRKNQRLQLNTEAIRALTSMDLERIVGGLSRLPCSTWTDLGCQDSLGNTACAYCKTEASC